MVTCAAIASARTLISPYLQSTPVTFDEQLGVWLKWENRQVTGSFKLRGALNKVLSLMDEERGRGLTAASAGNHGQGVAYAAKLVGARVTVYVPQQAARNKVEKMHALGAEVIRVSGEYSVAESTAIRVADELGRIFVSPYNDPLVIAGQGTLALELAEQCPEVSRWLIPVGGGGLITGIMAGAPNQVRVVGVQSEASPYLYHEYHNHDMSRAVELPSLADGLSGAIEPGSVTVEAIHGAADMRLVTEAQIAEAIAYAWHTHRQIVEGSGAVGLAAILSGQLKGDGKTVVLISGGNIDSEKHLRIISS